MSDSIKKTIEKNANGEYVFTAYGEFLSYFHAHLEVFKRFNKSKSVPQDKSSNQIQKLKAFMAGSVKNLDQYFHKIPEFAEILETTKDELSAYLNEHFLKILPIVQGKFKTTEIEKLQSGPHKIYERITEEILETTDYKFPNGCKFSEISGVLVIENTLTGELIQPQGLMAVASGAPSTTGLDPSAEKKQTPVKVLIDKPILEEIVEIYGSVLQGTELKIVSHIEPETLAPIKNLPSTKSEDVLEDIDDIDFEEPEEEPQMETESYSSSYDNDSAINDSPEHPEGVLDDLHDLLGINSEDDQQLVSAYIDSSCKRFNIENYFTILSQVNAFQSRSDADGYKSWLNQESEITKLVISLRTHIAKEIKSDVVDWDGVIEQLSSKTEFNKASIELMKEKVTHFQWIRVALDRCTAEFKKADTELLSLVKKAWPHIQKSFMLSPDYDSVLGQLKNILSKVANEAHRKELVRILTLTLNFCKAKYPPE
jgi:hypothetical protein